MNNATRRMWADRIGKGAYFVLPIFLAPYLLLKKAFGSPENLMLSVGIASVLFMLGGMGYTLHKDYHDDANPSVETLHEAMTDECVATKVSYNLKIGIAITNSKLEDWVKTCQLIREQSKVLK